MPVAEVRVNPVAVTMADVPMKSVPVTVAMPVVTMTMPVAMTVAMLGPSRWGQEQAKRQRRRTQEYEPHDWFLKWLGARYGESLTGENRDSSL
jgi:hypothetical protein